MKEYVCQKATLFHYEHSKEHYNKIMKSGKIISASFLDDPQGLYTERAKNKGLSKQEWFKERYDKFFKKALGKEWNGDYGIYFSVFDSFKLAKDDKRYTMNYRIKLSFNEIKNGGNDIIWQYTKKEIVKIESESQLLLFYNKYLRKIDYDEKKDNDKGFEDKLNFMHLPQVIVFAGKNGIPLKTYNFETLRK